MPGSDAGATFCSIFLSYVLGAGPIGILLRLHFVEPAEDEPADHAESLARILTPRRPQERSTAVGLGL